MAQNEVIFGGFVKKFLKILLSPKNSTKTRKNHASQRYVTIALWDSLCKMKIYCNLKFSTISGICHKLGGFDTSTLSGMETFPTNHSAH